MDCETECDLGAIGRNTALRYRPIMDTEYTIAAQMVVDNRKHGYPGPQDSYIGILRLDVRICGEKLLKEIEKRGKFLMDVGDKKDSNHWLESVTFPFDIGEKWGKSALFLQYRKKGYVEGEMLTGNKNRDVVLMLGEVVDHSLFEIEGVDRDLIHTCLQKAHLSVLPDDGADPYEKDYTRCAAFARLAY